MIAILWGTDNSITAFTLSLNGQSYKAYVSDNEIVVAVPGRCFAEWSERCGEVERECGD